MMNIEAQCRVERPGREYCGAVVRWLFDHDMVWRRETLWLNNYDWFSLHLKVPNIW